MQLVPLKYGVLAGQGISLGLLVRFPRMLVPEARFVAFGFDCTHDFFVGENVVPDGQGAQLFVSKLNSSGQ